MRAIPERLRAESPGALEQARTLLSSGAPTILQFDRRSYSRGLLQRINGLCREFGERLEVRFYGHYGSAFDFKVLRVLPDVANLATDCLQRAVNVEVLRELRQVRRLLFGVHAGDHTNPLTLLHPGMIRELWVRENARRNIDLSPLAEFSRLERLLIEGHTKGIEHLQGLPALEHLRLRCIRRKQPLDFVGRLPGLRSLELVLGGRTDIDEVESETLEQLDVIRVQGFARFPDLAKFPSLRQLKIEDQLQLAEIVIPDGCGSRLEGLIVNSCKRLAQLEGLAHLRYLERLRLCFTRLDVEAVLRAGLPEALDQFGFFTNSLRENERVHRLLSERGYTSTTPAFS